MWDKTIRVAGGLFVGGVLAAFGGGCGPADAPAEPVPGYADSALNTYALEVVPQGAALSEVLARPEEPFVMANLLAFKDMATGADFEGLTGEEAYLIYAAGLMEQQAAIGSRFIWSGRVQAQVVGQSTPTFEVLALLEYASPSAFLSFASSPGEAPEARTAGLLGQWLAASTTLDELPPSGPLTGMDTLPSVVELSATTGLSEIQIGRLLKGPASEEVYIVDLLAFADGSGDLYRPHGKALDVATAAHGGGLIWRGAYDTLVLGMASPAFQEMVVRRYPDRASYLATLADEGVTSASSARVNGLTTYWIYAAEPDGGL